MGKRAAKGPAFERSFCKALSLWWSEGRRDDCFWRTSNSGGRATVRGKKGKTTRNQHGDLCATDGEGGPLVGLICWELKRGYSQHTPFDLFDCHEDAAVQLYEEWADGARANCLKAGAFSWALVAKRDRRAPFVLLPDDLLEMLGLDLVLRWTLRFPVERQPAPLHVIRLDDFFGGLGPRRVVRAYENWAKARENCD